MTGRAAVSVLVLITCLGLAMVIYSEITEPTVETASAPMAPAAPAPRSTDADGQDTAYSMAPLQKFSEVTARPLFSQGRRPPVLVGQSADGPISSWVLHGIIISKGVRAALVEHGKPMTLTSAAVGQDIEGWTVVSIASDQVVLQSSGRQEALKLYSAEIDGQSPPVTSPPATASTPGAPSAGAVAPRRR